MSENKNNIQEFRLACKEYFATVSLEKLRVYGREIGVDKPTTKKKAKLIEEIIGILTEEIEPVERSRLGAPVLNDRLDPRIEKTVYKLRMKYLYGATPEAKPDFKYPDMTKVPPFDFQKARAEMLAQKEKNMLRVENPLASEYENGPMRTVHKGQLEIENSTCVLLPLDYNETEARIVMPVELIQYCDLREGDVVSCYARKHNNILVATQILTVNGVLVGDLKRNRFEECEACFPRKVINVYEEPRFSTVTEKFLQWLAPIGRGQRGLVVSSPKAGKTQLLQTLAEGARALNDGMMVFVLLVEQSPETVGQYRKIIARENLAYTTYEDEPERKVLSADYILKRAKRYAESGRDVLLIVDSFNALARAYNETEESAGGKMISYGLESKTLQYLKRYFGSARCLEKSGSLTILGAAASATGNPVDELITAELSALSNFELRLSEDFAYKRVFPALEPASVRIRQNGLLANAREGEIDALIRSRYIPAYGAEGLHKLLADSNSYEDFISALDKAVSEK